MSKPVGELTIEPEPSPVSEAIDYPRALETALGTIYPNQLDTIIKLGDKAIVHLYAEYEDEVGEPSFAFTASVSDEISSTYRHLDASMRNDLVCEVRQAMAHQAYLLNPTNSYDEYCDNSIAIMENEPLFFEPSGEAMLRGRWGGRLDQQLHFEADDVMSMAQRQILLGGFAIFVDYVARQNS